MRVRTKFIAINTVIVAASLLAAVTACLSTFDRELRREAKLSQEMRLKTFWELLNQKGNEIRIDGGLLKIGDYTLNSNFELPDPLMTICGGTATIFMGDERVSTNVVKQDGSRAIGTRLTGPAHQAVFKEGKPYRGEAEIFGAPYFTAYDPIRDPKGEVIGALYVGVKKSEFYAAYHQLQKIILIIICLVLLVRLSAEVVWERMEGTTRFWGWTS